MQQDWIHVDEKKPSRDQHVLICLLLRTALYAVATWTEFSGFQVDGVGIASTSV